MGYDPIIRSSIISDTICEDMEIEIEIEIDGTIVGQGNVELELELEFAYFTPHYLQQKNIRI